MFYRAVDFNDRVPDELTVRFSLTKVLRETERIVTINLANCTLYTSTFYIKMSTRNNIN